MTRPEWIEVGRVSRAHGVHGEVRVVPSSDNPDRFEPGAVLFCRPAGGGVRGPDSQKSARLTIDGLRGDEAFPIVSFSEVPDRTAAEALRGHTLLVPADELPSLPEGEYYPFELMGAQVRDESGATRGTVADVLESPAHWMVIVRAVASAYTEDGAPAAETSAAEVESMVPFVYEAVPEIDLEEGYIVVASRFLQ